jgi:hypothetical protein
MAMMAGLIVVFPSSDNPIPGPTNTAPTQSIPTSPPPGSGDPDFSIGGALNPQYYSTAGAFNGTGLALASQSFGQDDRGEIVMYFQHWSGDLRWSQLMSDGSWQGGSASETLARDARNGTPISAVAYSMGEESIWHIFYIDLNNTVRERINSNTTNVWREGPLSKRKLKANRADQVGMQACWFGNFYGDSSFKKSDAFNAPNTDGRPNDQVGMRLWYASSDTTFEQLGWLHGEVSVYTTQREYMSIDSGGSRMIGFLKARGRTRTVELGSDAIPGVPAASPTSSWSTLTTPSGSGGGTQTQACPETSATPSTNGQIVRLFSFLPLSPHFSLFITLLRHPCRDFLSRPNSLFSASISIPNLHPSTSLGYTNYLYVQSSDHTIHGYNISFHSENTSFVPDDDFTILTAGNGSLGLAGTHLSVTTLPNPSGGNDLFAFYQTEGDDVSVFSRDMLAGPWAATKVAIPDD